MEELNERMGRIVLLRRLLLVYCCLFPRRHWWSGLFRWLLLLCPKEKHRMNLEVIGLHSESLHSDLTLSGFLSMLVLHDSLYRSWKDQGGRRLCLFCCHVLEKQVCEFSVRESLTHQRQLQFEVLKPLSTRSTVEICTRKLFKWLIESKGFTRNSRLINSVDCVSRSRDFEPDGRSTSTSD